MTDYPVAPLVVKLTFGGKVADSGSTVALYLDAGRIGERDQHLANAHL
jgi:hypothetical protein